MLNLNAMFGSCESIFGTEAPRRPISSTELQMMEMEIATDLANAEVDNARISSTNMQLDQLLNMYNHVKKFGIDRTFLSLHNSNGQLNNMLGIKFPSCESVNSIGSTNSNMSKLFIVAMEDEKEGIFAKIIKGLKWIWEKIKHICSVIWNKIKSWIGLGTKKTSQLLDTVINAKDNGNKRKGVVKVLTNKKVIAGALATVTAISGIIMGYKKLKTPEQKNQAAKNLEEKTNELAELSSEIQTESKEVSSIDEVKPEAKEEKAIAQELDKIANNEDQVNKGLQNVSEEELNKANRVSDADLKAVVVDQGSNDEEDDENVDKNVNTDGIQAQKRSPIERVEKDFDRSHKWVSRKGADKEPYYGEVLRSMTKSAKVILKAETTKTNVLRKIMAALYTVSINQEEFAELVSSSELSADKKRKLVERYSRLKRKPKLDDEKSLKDRVRNINYYNRSLPLLDQ